MLTQAQISVFWKNGVFTGTIDDSIAPECEVNSVECTGKAGRFFYPVALMVFQ